MPFNRNGVVCMLLTQIFYQFLIDTSNSQMFIFDASSIHWQCSTEIYVAEMCCIACPGVLIHVSFLYACTWI